MSTVGYGYGYGPGMNPYTAGGLAPQGFLGGALGSMLGGALGNTVGGWFGGSDIGQTIGSTLGGIGGGLLPFAAGPGVMPQSFFPQPINWISPTVGPTIPIWGGNMPPGMSGNVLPFSAGPMLRPQGFFGDLLGQVGAPLGGLIGGALGNQGLGNTIGGWAGQLGSLLPFSAGPMLRPQGFFGDLLGQVGAPLGGWIGSQFGNQGLGNTIGGLAGQLGSLLPFSAGPMLRPQGFFGDLLGQFGGPLGNWVGSQTGSQGLGNVVGGLATTLADLLPFSAGPMLRPQGFFGDLLGQVGAPLGGWIGSQFGNQGLGNTIGGLAGQFGSLLPFSAVPAARPVWY